MITIQLWSKKTGASKVAVVVEKFRARAEYTIRYSPWLKENNIEHTFDPVAVSVILDEEDALAFKLKFQL